MAKHPLAVVSPGAKLGDGVDVGPFAYIADGAIIEAGCVIMSHATVLGGTHLGPGCRVHQGAVIGGDPQDKKYAGQTTFLEVGPRTVFREYVTVSRGTSEGAATRIGADCLFMTGAHVGHDCFIGNHVTIANTVNLGGHCEIHDRAVIGGLCAIHQFVRIGTMAMVGGDTGLSQDAPPYMLTAGLPAAVYGLNTVGLMRNGLDPDARRRLKQAFRLLYRSGLPLSEAVERIKADLPMEAEIAELLKFIAGSRRGLTVGSLERRGRARGAASAIAADPADRNEPTAVHEGSNGVMVAGAVGTP
ncbi:MAG TPA: acyl-ACP--UDP-N-acetylglucosamine O-acyltransferase [bacterium]|nr:acyl-ACP--UDP-N-acetylglucosamine O-acyltransferase [bacterium]